MSSALVKNRKRGTRPDRMNMQQQAFVEHLLADRTFNATEAARKAGYAHHGAQATKLLNKPAIRNAIGKACYERSQRMEVSADRTLRELAYIGFVDPIDLFDAEGKVLPLHKMPEGIRRAVKNIKVRSYETQNEDGSFGVATEVSVDFWPKIEALSLIAKHLGLLNDKLSVKHEFDQTFMAELLRRVEAEHTDMVIDAKSILAAAT